MLWILEPNVYSTAHPLTLPAFRAGHNVVWYDLGLTYVSGVVLFHGSLNTAMKLRNDPSFTMRPGVFCNADAFAHSSWARDLKDWILNPEAIYTTLRELLEQPEKIREKLKTDQVFVRPDSTLKPFFGRVVALKDLTPDHFDYGYYYEDLNLPILVAEEKDLHDEFRFIVVNGKVVDGCQYDPLTHRDLSDRNYHVYDAWAYAQSAVSALPSAPELAYVIDIGHTALGWKVVELNPFSGSDLYSCQDFIDPLANACVDAMRHTWQPKGTI